MAGPFEHAQSPGKTASHAEVPLGRCALSVLGLSIFTVGLILENAGAEPFMLFRIQDALLHVGFGGLLIVGWCTLAVVLGRGLFRGQRSMGLVALFAASVTGTWISIWSPRAYIEDRLQFGTTILHDLPSLPSGLGRDVKRPDR
jgi:hypothetical protein